MNKLIIPAIGFFIILGIYYTSLKKEKIQNEIKLEKRHQQEEAQKKNKLLKEIDKLRVSIEQACENNNIKKLNLLKEKLVIMKTSEKYDVVLERLNGLIPKIDDCIHKINNQEKTFEKFCIDSYNELEQQYQNAIGLINDDENKIANVKARAIELINKGCDKYLENSLKNLIYKCDDELD